MESTDLEKPLTSFSIPRTLLRFEYGLIRKMLVGSNGDNGHGEDVASCF